MKIDERQFATIAWFHRLEVHVNEKELVRLVPFV
jgi:hypothetical protein